MNILRSEQRYFDRVAFDPQGGYAQLEKNDAKIAHISLHLGKIVGRKMLNWQDAGDIEPEVIKGEILPDLCMYRTQIVTIVDHNDTCAPVAPKNWLTPGSLAQQKKLAYRFAVTALGNLSDYIEPVQHGVLPQKELLWRAVGNLDESIYYTAHAVGIGSEDVAALHLARLEQQLGGEIKTALPKNKSL